MYNVLYGICEQAMIRLYIEPARDTIKLSITLSTKEAIELARLLLDAVIEKFAVAGSNDGDK